VRVRIPPETFQTFYTLSSFETKSKAQRFQRLS